MLIGAVGRPRRRLSSGFWGRSHPYDYILAAPQLLGLFKIVVGRLPELLL
jgi:hypothetical protein